MTLAFRLTNPTIPTLDTGSRIIDGTGLSWPLIGSSTSRGSVTPVSSIAEPTAEVGGRARRSAIAHLRHELLIGLGAFAVLAGVLAFSIFGQPRSVAGATGIGVAAPGGSLAAAMVSLPAPAALAVAVQDRSAEVIDVADDPAAAAVAQQTLDVRNAFLASVAQQGADQTSADQIAADQASAQQPAELAAAPAAVAGANTGRVAPAAASGGVWDQLAQCESGGNWSINTGNGFSGGLQFMRSTWLGVGGGEYAPDAYLATREQQIDMATRVLASQGWGAWPGCASLLGLR